MDTERKLQSLDPWTSVKSCDFRICLVGTVGCGNPRRKRRRSELLVMGSRSVSCRHDAGVECGDSRAGLCHGDHGEHAADGGGFQAGKERRALLGMRRVLREPHVPLPRVDALPQVIASRGSR